MAKARLNELDEEAPETWPLFVFCFFWQAPEKCMHHSMGQVIYKNQVLGEFPNTVLV